MNFQAEFERDCREKKRTASGEKYRVKSHGRVRFPSDYLSKKEKRKLNGEVVTYNLYKPMEYSTFRRLGTDIQKKYIIGLIDRFGVSRREIANMMKCSDTTLRTLYKECGIKAKKGGSHNWHEDAWRSWLCEPKDFNAVPDSEYVKPKEEEHEKEEKTVVEPTETVTEKIESKGNEIIFPSTKESNMDGLRQFIEELKAIGCHTKITVEIDV